MQIVAALFIENINFRRDFEGGPTKIDITGAYFSTTAPAFPTTLTPHLVVLLRAESEAARTGTLEVRFVHEGETDEASRHRAPVTIAPPGKFFYQLVKPDLTFEAAGTIEAHCTIVETGSTVVVPLSVIM